MVISMTGYGRGLAKNDELQVNVEIKTVNHRFCEYQIRMPRQLMFLEDKIKKQVSEYIKRGRAEVFVTVEGKGLVNRKLVLDWDLVDDFFILMKQVKEKYNLSSCPEIQDILQIENILSVEEEHTENSYLENILSEAVKEAAANLIRMRQIEGAELSKDIMRHLKKIFHTCQILKGFSPAIIENYKSRLLERITEYTSGHIDETRLLTEVAIFADKADINEELTRLESHIAQFETTLDLREPIGRKLDFLVQEMNREINTIGSKANDSKITNEVVEMKSSLEKIKEQVQNIE